LATATRGIVELESDRVLLVIRIANETFGSEEKAEAWLRRPNRALGGSTPVDLMATIDGADSVEQVLGRLAHGLFS
jgi:putative toxin-antitoxin system antitoxin component (TIGR02293 family)